ncbi:hypothetical protein CRYUN_Cryun28dG0029900 [Craigia yunnanensis]
MSNNPRIFSAHPHNTPCTRTHQIGALILITATFFFTRLFNQSFPPSPCNLIHDHSSQNVNLRVAKSNGVLWPERGYGSHLSLNIYVYDENEIDGLKDLLYGRDGTVSTNACLKGQWVLRLLLESRFRTRKKDEADLFFVPAYVKCVRMLGGLNDKEINQTYVKVLSQMPYFRQSGGRDHMFVFPSGAGAHLFRSWAIYINRSIILTPEGDCTDKKDTSAFNTWKDIIIPGNVDDGMTKTGATISQPLPLECPELQFSGPEKLGRVEYFQHLGNAKFCLAPRGESSWTLRFYESFFVECVPVILSDQVELPFQNVIDYTQISIKWPSTLIGPELLEYLASIPGQIGYSLLLGALIILLSSITCLNFGVCFSDDVINQMIARGRQVKCMWVSSPDSEACYAMQAVMWELQRKVRQFHQSAEAFWLHNGSIVNGNLVEFTNWKPPMPLP